MVHNYVNSKVGTNMSNTHDVKWFVQEHISCMALIHEPVSHFQLRDAPTRLFAAPKPSAARPPKAGLRPLSRRRRLARRGGPVTQKPNCRSRAAWLAGERTTGEGRAQGKIANLTLLAHTCPREHDAGEQRRFRRSRQHRCRQRQRPDPSSSSKATKGNVERCALVKGN